MATLLVFAVLAAPAFAAAADHMGRVLFNDRPVPGASVMATSGSVTKTTTSDADGAFRLADLADGEWAVTVTMVGFQPETRTIAVPGDGTPSGWTLTMKTFAEMGAREGTGGLLLRSAPAAGTGVDPGRERAATGGVNASPVDSTLASSFLVNGSVNNGAASPFAQMNAFGNNRRSGRSLYNGGLGIVLGNSALDSRPFSFSNVASPKPSYDDLQILGTFSGPIRLPRLLRNGPGVFAGYQHGLAHTMTTESTRVPTPLERAGDFSQSVDASGRAIVPIDPTTGLPFADRRLPAGRLAPQAAALLGYYPLPNIATGAFNYQAPLLSAVTQDNVQLRATQNLGRANAVYGAFLYSRVQTEAQSLFGFTDTSRASTSDVSLNWWHRVSQTMTVRTTYQRTGQGAATTPYFARRENVSGRAGITGNDQSPENWGPPALTFASGFASLASPSYADNHGFTETWAAESTLARGRHSITIGGGTGRQVFDVFSQQDARGTLGFTGSTTGVDLVDFLLGYPSTASIAFGNPDKYLGGKVANVYVSDDWRVSSSLTINAGARWELETPFTERTGRLANLDVDSSFRAAAVVVPGSRTGPVSGQTITPSLLRVDWRGIQPRVGAAWRPVAGSSLVVRAGYGAYRNTGTYQAVSLLLAQQPPFSKAFSTASSTENPLALGTVFSAPAAETGNTFAVDPALRIGYAHTWQMSAQRDLPWALTILGTYSGSSGRHLLQQFLPNTVAPGAVNSCSACPIGFTYLASNGTSLRNAAQMQVRRRLAGGFTSTVQYTLAKTTDNASAFVPTGNPAQAGGPGAGGPTSAGLAGAAIAQDWHNLEAERSRSPFDERHQLSVQFEYTTGMGLVTGLGNGIGARLLKGWTVTGQMTTGSGLPVTPIALVPLAGSGIVGTVRASAVGDAAAPPGFYLNPANYALPARGEWGSAGRNSVSGPRQFSFNSGVGRSFILGDRFTLDWRVDATNLLNTVTYAGINSVVGSPQFGLPNRANSMRKLQATARLRF